jgi:hypothetical protein
MRLYLGAGFSRLCGSLLYFPFRRVMTGVEWHMRAKQQGSFTKKHDTKFSEEDNPVESNPFGSVQLLDIGWEPNSNPSRQSTEKRMQIAERVCFAETITEAAQELARLLTKPWRGLIETAALHLGGRKADLST